MGTRLRAALIVPALVAATVALTVPTASASTGPTARSLAHQIVAASQHVLTSVSCVSSDDCLDIGWAETAGGDETGTSQLWTGGGWQNEENILIPAGALSNLILPQEVSCVSSTQCMMAGEFYHNYRSPTMLTELWNGSYWTFSQTANPGGAEWSDLDDISCVASSSCMAVGLIGKQRRSFNHTEAFAEQWSATVTTNNGWQRLSPPVPAGAKNVELDAVSCVSASYCVVAGFYPDTSKKVHSFAASWNGASWQLMRMPARRVVPEALSCTAPGSCIMVGNTPRPFRTVAEQLSGGTWGWLKTPALHHSNYLNSVSCFSATQCMAVGGDGAGPLAELWNGSTWRISKIVRTRKPRNSDDMTRVSCPAAGKCIAVGLRAQVKVTRSFSQADLAEIWNGQAWRVMSG
jgi:hypothetical protein